MSKYDIAAIRKQLASRVGSAKDPNEFKPPKVDDNTTLRYRFFILPPFTEGEQIVGGPATRDMDMFFISSGAHYIDNKRLGCPRIMSRDECSLCSYAFSLLKDIKDRENAGEISKEVSEQQRKSIRSNLLSSEYYMVNIYFPEFNSNPEDLRGKVLYYNAPKTIFDMWYTCITTDEDCVDEIEPQPSGIFFDENAAYLFQLEVKKKGQGNNYEASKFLDVKSGKVRIAAEDKIPNILKSRHDLYAKLPTIKIVDLDRITENLSKGGSASAGTTSNNGGFDHDDTNTSKSSSSGSSKPETKTEVKTEVKTETKVEAKTESKKESQPEVKEEPVKQEIKEPAKTEHKQEVKESKTEQTIKHDAQSSDEDEEVAKLLQMLNE